MVCPLESSSLSPEPLRQSFIIQCISATDRAPAQALFAQAPDMVPLNPTFYSHDRRAKLQTLWLIKKDRNMNFGKMIIAYAIAIASSGLACAQSTVGELLDQGAVKLGKDDWIAVLPITSSGVWSSGDGETQADFKADGTFSGNARDYIYGTSSGVYGTWKVDDFGMVCFDEKFSRWTTTTKGCFVRFKLGEQFFHAPSATDRGAKVVKRTYTK